jgi:hypothetical protein
VAASFINIVRQEKTNSAEANDVGPILYKTKEQNIYVKLRYIHMDYDNQDHKLKTIPTRH